jgi:hypothetical protein
MRKFFFVKIFFLFYIFLFIFDIKTEAGFFKFNKDTINIAPNQDFTVDLIVDPESDPIVSIDAYIQFDSNVIETIDVTDANYFSILTHEIRTSSVYIGGMNDLNNPKTGVGQVATIKFRAKTNGATTLTFNCSASKIVKNDTDSTNVLSCDKNKTIEVTVGQGSASTTNTTSATDSGKTQLPATGVFDDTGKFLLPGVILLLSGMIGRFLLKF